MQQTSGQMCFISAAQTGRCLRKHSSLDVYRRLSRKGRRDCSDTEKWFLREELGRTSRGRTAHGVRRRRTFNVIVVRGGEAERRGLIMERECTVTMGRRRRGRPDRGRQQTGLWSRRGEGGKKEREQGREVRDRKPNKHEQERSGEGEQRRTGMGDVKRLRAVRPPA